VVGTAAFSGVGRLFQPESPASGRCLQFVVALQSGRIVEV